MQGHTCMLEMALLCGPSLVLIVWGQSAVAPRPVNPWSCSPMVLAKPCRYMRAWAPLQAHLCLLCAHDARVLMDAPAVLLDRPGQALQILQRLELAAARKPQGLPDAPNSWAPIQRHLHAMCCWHEGRTRTPEACQPSQNFLVLPPCSLTETEALSIRQRGNFSAAWRHLLHICEACSDVGRHLLVQGLEVLLGP